MKKRISLLLALAMTMSLVLAACGAAPAAAPAAPAAEPAAEAEAEAPAEDAAEAEAPAEGKSEYNVTVLVWKFDDTYGSTVRQGMQKWAKEVGDELGVTINLDMQDAGDDMAFRPQHALDFREPMQLFRRGLPLAAGLVCLHGHVLSIVILPILPARNSSSTNAAARSVS